MDGKDLNKGVARMAENSTATRAAMDECELAEAFRDEGKESIVSDPKMTRAKYSPYSPYGFGCSCY